jgi:hypothetical protein
MSKRKADAPPSPPFKRETRQGAQLQNANKDPDAELQRISSLEEEHKKGGRAFCSHCGQWITPATYFSSFTLHYGNGESGSNWNTTTGEWLQTANDRPKKPLEGYDAYTISLRMNQIRKLGEVKKQGASRPSHLLDNMYMNGAHDGILNGEIQVYDDMSATNSDSDSPADSENNEWYDGEVLGEVDDMGSDEHKDNDPPVGPPEPSPVAPVVCSEIDPFFLLLRAWKGTSGTTDQDFTTLLQLLKTLENLPEVAPDVPTTTLHTINVAIGADQDLFDSICVCGKCGRLYDREGCERKVNDVVTRSRFCCNAPLLKRSFPTSTTWTPVLTYPCVDVETALSEILLREGINKSLNHWMKRKLPAGSYGDLYEGEVWREFQEWKGVPFLSSTGIGLMLNMDGFQPFKRRQYSVQGIYLAIMNLPRHLRYRRENMILVGLIPGGKEKIPLSHFINRLTDQLKALWEKPSSVFNRKVALLAVACDVPAGRKLCGMVSHASARGCSRCDCLYDTEKNAKGGPPTICWDKPSGADGSGQFQNRTRQEHFEYGTRWKDADTKKESTEISQNTGYRWTPFLRLEYFEPSRMTVLDPLHNMWEGLFKDLLKQFLKGTNKKVTKLSDKLLAEFEIEVGRCRFPRSMGPVLGKIGHKMSRFTGHELKNLLNTFFLWLVDGSITEDEWQLVQHLHQASRIADERFVTTDQIETMEDHLVKYCDLYETVYGGKELKPNHHLCRHLGGFMRDYGPTCAFWLFAFERYNGIMTNYNTRASVVETSMFRQYTIQSLIIQRLNSALEDVSHSDNIIGRNLTVEESQIARLLLAHQTITCGNDNSSGADFDAYRCRALKSWNGQSYYEVRGHEYFPGELLNFSESGSVITKQDVNLLRSSLTSLHQKLGHTWAANDDFKVREFHRYKDMRIGGITYQSGSSARSSHVLFKSESSKSLQVPAMVLYYCNVEVDMCTGDHKIEHEKLTDFEDVKSALDACPWIAGYEKRTFTFARVDWFPAAARGTTRIHFEKWSVHLQTDPKFAFIPVARIVSGFVPLLGSSNSEFCCGPLRGHFVF